MQKQAFLQALGFTLHAPLPPSLHLLSPSLPFAFNFPPLPSFPPFRSRSLKYSQGVWGSAVSSFSAVLAPGGAKAESEFGAFSLRNWHLATPILLILLRINWLQANYWWGQMHYGPPNLTKILGGPWPTRLTLQRPMLYFPAGLTSSDSSLRHVKFFPSLKFYT